jgi:hypothetical protein
MIILCLCTMLQDGGGDGVKALLPCVLSSLIIFLTVVYFSCSSLLDRCQMLSMPGQPSFVFAC